MASQTLDEAARFAAIVELSSDAILAIDLNGIITTWNPAAERIYGYSAAEIIGQPNWIIIPPDRRAEEEDVRQRLSTGGTVGHYASVRVRKDGRRISVSMTVSALRDRDGSLVGFLKISHDTSKEEQSLADARRLAAIVESSDDAIIGMDMEGTISAWNRAAERMYGYRAEEAIGRSIRITLPPERYDEESSFLAQIARGGRVEHFETIRCGKGGHFFPVSLTISPIRDGAGRVIGASKTARDITERRHVAERAAFLAEAGAVLAASLEYAATLKTIANLAVPAVSDWCAVDVLTEDGKLERLAVAHVDPTKIELARAIRPRYEDPTSPYSPAFVMRSGAPAFVKEITDEMIVAGAGGDEEHVELIRSLGLRSYIVVPLTAHGRTLGALTLATAESGRLYTDDDFRFAQDVAFRAALAIDNARAYNEAQAANRLKDEFLATLSHELRTPLNAILGYARLVRSGLMPSERRAHALGTIERNANALAQIIEDILDVSRIIAGKVRLNIQSVDLPDVVNSAVETLLPAAEAKQIRIRTIADPRAAPVSGDPDRLQQIIWNLISNAVKFTPKGGQVQVRVQRVNSHIEIVISDTGAGIAPDFLPHIFDRFRQGDSGTTREHGGLGLGLAIVRHLVELHGGTVYATSAGRHQGATFHVRLPLMVIHPATSEERRVHPTTETPVLPTDLPQLAGIHVLAVDDDADARALVSETLEMAGAQVTTADSAAQALAILETTRPDVVLADIGLAHVDGYELITRIRRLADPAIRDLPAAALTAYARAEDRVKALRSGFQLHLAKPIDPAELVVAVAALAKR